MEMVSGLETRCDTDDLILTSTNDVLLTNEIICTNIAVRYCLEDE